MNIATANIIIRRMYFLEHHLYYTFDISFENSSTMDFYNLIIANNLGKDKNEAKLLYSNIVDALKKAGITNYSRVAVIFNEEKFVTHIAASGSNIWLDTKHFEKTDLLSNLKVF